MRNLLLLVAVALAGYLAASTLGASLELLAVALAFVPVLLAWLALCGKLSANEPQMDAMLDERAATLRASLSAARTRAYTGKTVRLNEVQR